MMHSWQEDHTWSRKFLPEIERICGEYLISEAPAEEDAQRNTDLIVLGLGALRIACRIRSASYLNHYAGEFTIREGRPNGTKTELTKIIEGWGDYFFYGFADEDECALAAWLLGDLRVFRLWFNRQLMRLGGKLPGQSFENDDGSSTFRVFTIAELPTDFVLAQKIAVSASVANRTQLDLFPPNGHVHDWDDPFA